MATVADVAKRANVSVATVSRVLHDSDLVSEELRTKVLQAIDELGYEMTTRTLKNQHQRFILVLCGNIIDNLISGINDAANRLSYEVFFAYTMGQKANYTKFIRNMAEIKSISGLLTVGISPNAVKDLAKISKQVPIVQCCDEIPSLDPFIVSSDDVLAAQEMVSHLISIGKKRIGFLGLDRMLHPFKYSSHREIGYRRALEKAGMSIDPDLIKHSDFTLESSLEAARSFLSMEQRPDAVFCVRDSLAIMLIKALHEANVRIPEDIAVAGFGGNENDQLCWPNLTTVEQSYYTIGEESVNLLHARIESNLMTGRRLFIQHKLLIRDSTVANPTAPLT